MPPRGLGTTTTTSHWFSKGMALAPRPTARGITFAIELSVPALQRRVFQTPGNPPDLSVRHSVMLRRRFGGLSPPGTAAYLPE